MTIPHLPQAALLAAIQQYRENLLDLDTAHDDAIHAVAAALLEQESAWCERERCAAYLQFLLDLHADAAGVADTFGDEIAGYFVAGVVR